MTKSSKKMQFGFFSEAKVAEEKTVSWAEQEQQDLLKILEAFWDERLIKYNKKSVDLFKRAIQFKNPDQQEQIEKLFNDAINYKIDFETFAKTILALKENSIYVMNQAEKLIAIQDIPYQISEHDIFQLQQYIKEKNMSASIALRANNGPIITPNFPENQTNSTFAMHSVGKVLTGMLLLIMVRNGILSEKDINSPIQLDDTIFKKLSPAYQAQLKKVTLHQVMTHHADLGDYLESYLSTITNDSGPTIKTIDDFIPFLGKDISPNHYSNDGILLLGFAIQHAYEKHTGRYRDFYDMLQEYIIDKAGMTSCSPWRPANGKFNLEAPKDQYIVGSPAGGFWITAEDLARFGNWIYQTCATDPEMKRLIEKFGQEFYPEPQRELLSHMGSLISSSAFFSVSLKTGAIIAILSDQPNTAFALNAVIQNHLIADTSLSISDEEMANSAVAHRKM